MELMNGKRGVIMGLANKKSIAWGICNSLKEAGAELILTAPNERMVDKITPLAADLNAGEVIECDVTSTEAIKKTFEEVEKRMGKIDFLVHAIAFSDKTGLTGAYYDTTKDNFLMTMDISVYSFTAVAKEAGRIMNDGGSMVTLTYYGAEQVMPRYNVMGVAKAALEASVRYLAHDFGPKGIRVNAISAGPIKTLAASGIGDFRYILKWNEFNSPLQRNVTIDEVGNSALYLLSDLSTGVTGENLHVDSGYHTVGMLNMDRAAETSELLSTVK
ncbi:MAG: SDR family oxidoreductase [Alphaproteobacteria bacterium]|jgi:enoyl-[acyl-carrier protein] reductase I|nr:SDR family oxidoreductase [Alphaproteobacteria bacterium]MCV6599425.1 SDR family oxidoreductase [Alphaproteobacteria bacterium]